ncbi:BtrH N-terminal domain-containing protein [Micromonospora echinofusca]|uniref:Butirosin biosynthesis protein H, N-terminal n=1 Tax=Micromonospora echinofusca TaxID=47858 RepID=A0ABS3VJI2_MICEH|nr:BtrH N-terminal domain-containing protein [Micromonospora echinofusca]MBO4204636.1 hypothetical protein [Micromonospora echinofusca]
MRRPPPGAFVPCADQLRRVDGALLDCVSDDIALLLAARGVDDLRDPFARDWRFVLRRPVVGLPQVELPAADQDDLLARRTGLRPRWRPAGPPGQWADQWRRALHAGDPVLLVGDAYHLPWLPYHGHEHMDHGFVLEGIGADDTGGGPVAHVVDPYDNATEWGRATPLATRLPLADLRAALSDGRWATLVQESAVDATPDPDQQVAANAAAVLRAAGQGTYATFLDAHRSLGRAELANLTVQTWLLARDRGLHARWLADRPAGTRAAALADRFDGEIAAGWRRAAEATYLAARRVRSGRRAPGSALTTVQAVVAAETALARSLEEGEPRC